MNDELFPSADSAPYTLPLTGRAFADALRVGHGRAVQHAAAHGISDRAEVVLHATLHDLSNDPQCEGERGPWMLKLIEAAKAGADIFPEVVGRATDPPDGDDAYWHLGQRAAVLAGLARRGVDGARESLYAMLQKAHASLDLIGAAEIIELDGADGLIRVCDTMGGWIQTDPAIVLDDAPIRTYDDIHGDGAAARILENVRDRQDVDRYLRRLAEDEGGDTDSKSGRGHVNPANVNFKSDAGSQTERIASRTVADIIEWIENTPVDPRNVGYCLTHWGRRADEPSLRLVAEALDGATEAGRIVRYLRVFARQTMPFVSDAILAFGRHEDKEVGSAAYRALGNVSNPRVRALALDVLSPERMVDGAIGLFECSYQPGDHAAIENALFMPEDREQLHTMISDVADVCDKNVLPECLRLLLFVYENSPCGNCRCRAVEVMTRLDAVPAWVAAECRSDAMEDLRVRFGGVGS